MRWSAAKDLPEKEAVFFLQLTEFGSFSIAPSRLYTATRLDMDFSLQHDMNMKPLVMGGKDGGDDSGTDVATKTRTRTARPPLYKVILLNDDYTPMEFVVHVLERFFGLNHQQAFDIMLTVHKKGLAVVGVFSFEVAETKVAQVMDLARQEQHPLQCTMEKE